MTSAPQIAAALRAIADALDAQHPTPEAPPAERLLIYPQVAAALNVDVSTARKLGKAGEFPEVRLNSGVRVREADLNAYIRAKAGANP